MGKDISKIIEKVQALRALAAKAGTVDEAKAAMAQAEAIIAKYRLDEAEIGTASTETEEPINGDDVLWSSGKSATWLSILAVRLCKHYGCYTYHQRVLEDRRWVTQFKIVGRPSDVGIVKYMFAWLRTEIDRLSDMEHGLHSKNSFRRGAVYAVTEALSGAAKVEQDKRQSTTSAITLASRADEAERWAKSRFSLHKVSSRTSLDRGALERGQKAGAGIHLGASLPAHTRALPAKV